VEQFSLQAKDEIHRVSLTDLPAGMYVVLLKNGQTLTRKKLMLVDD
tara:strand:+ start:215458 stop:215595 length:138 start_codon:yes stop_codon:yes gene_type:complete